MTVFTEPNFESHASSTNISSRSSVHLKYVHFIAFVYVCFGYKTYALYTEAITCRLLIFHVISIKKYTLIKLYGNLN